MGTSTNIDSSINGEEQKSKNHTMFQAFEWYSPGGGVHWNSLKHKVPELSSMGITAMWLPPPTKAAGEESVGYDIYDLWDLGEFEQKAAIRTKYGTKEELVSLTRFARENGELIHRCSPLIAADGHSSGIVSYVDAVLNHKFGADHTENFRVFEVDGDNREHDTTDDYYIDGWTNFDFPGRKGTYSQMEWNYYNFTGVDYDQSRSKKDIFRVSGKEWAHHVGQEHRNYDYLMGADIDHHDPQVHKDLLAWGKWVIDQIGAGGFRFDAIKHIDRRFIGDFVEHVRQKSNDPSMFTVGEFWTSDLGEIDGYLNSLGMQFSVFDAPLHYRFRDAGDAGNRFDLRTIFDNTLVQKRPVNAVTLVDNHDTQLGQSLRSWVSPWFKPIAYALILLRAEGYPCVFYGDLYGCEGGKPQPPKPQDPEPQQPMSQLADFIRARKLFAYGGTWDRFDHPNCIGWVRSGDKWHDGCAVVVCNGDEGRKFLYVGPEHGGEKWTDLLGWHKGEVTIGENGWAEFYCPARSASIWTKTDARGREEFNRG